MIFIDHARVSDDDDDDDVYDDDKFTDLTNVEVMKSVVGYQVPGL
jgi:hypothetical protein